MTNEERDLIAQFIQRVGGQPAGGGFAGSVPATSALPPIDREADALLADLFQRVPEARYRVTQYAFVQEHALAEAQNTIRQLQAQLAQVQAQAQTQPAPSPWGAMPQRGYPQQPQAYAPAPQPQSAPGQQPGMFQQQGTGFLGSALRTAAGVAGGIFAADALMGLFGGRGGGFGGGFGGGGFGGGGFTGGGNTTIIQNNYGNGGNDPLGAGGNPNDQGAGWTDTQGGADPGGWTDASAGDPGGFDPGSDMGGDAGGFDSDPNSV